MNTTATKTARKKYRYPSRDAAENAQQSATDQEGREYRQLINDCVAAMQAAQQ